MFIAMPIRQITIIGTGLIGGSLALALKKQKFAGTHHRLRPRCRPRTRPQSVAPSTMAPPIPATPSDGSEVVVLATPVRAIIDLIERLGPALPAKTLLTDVGSTKTAVARSAQRKCFGKKQASAFSPGHPMAGKELSGVDFADPDLFQGAAWFLTPSPGQNLYEGLCAEFPGWIEQIGARIASLPAESTTSSAPGSATCRK